MYFATELKTNLIKVKSERISFVFLMSISLWTNFNKVSLIVFELVLFLQSKVSSHFSWYSCCFVCFQCRFVLLFFKFGNWKLAVKDGTKVVDRWSKSKIYFRFNFRLSKTCDLAILYAPQMIRNTNQTSSNRKQILKRFECKK